MDTPPKNTNVTQKPLILYAALDWGLGHAGRSVAIVRLLLDLGADVVIACNSTQRIFFQAEFPNLYYIEIQGYNIKYGKTRVRTGILLWAQLKKILTKVKYEKAWLDDYVQKNRVDAIISDNRYGIYSTKHPCVLITHQLQLITGWGKIADRLARRFIYRWINRFSECWVPDFKKDNDGLAGRLSHPTVLPKTAVRYLGCFSRFEYCDKISFAGPQGSTPIRNVLIIISGPEPQRSIFERIVCGQAGQLDAKEKNRWQITVLRGKPDEADYSSEPADSIHADGRKLASPIKRINPTHVSDANLNLINHARSSELNILACEADLIICRSGYTTLMDMLKLRKRMVIVPTPGQTEQEYLARTLGGRNWAIAVSQSQFSLRDAIGLAENSSFELPEWDMDNYKGEIISAMSGLLNGGFTFSSPSA